MVFSKRKLHVQATVYAALKVRTNQQSQVESDPVQSDSQDVAGTLWPTVAAEAVYTHQQSRVQASPVQSHESCRVKSLDAACFIFVSQTPVIGRDGCYLEE